jgi:hypothetical protein
MYHCFGNLDLDRSYHTTICDTNLRDSDMFEEAITFENKAILIVTFDDCGKKATSVWTLVK